MTLEKCLFNILNTSALQLGHKSPTLHFLDNALFTGYLFLTISCLISLIQNKSPIMVLQ
jgi:hypothetical protein